MKDSDYRITNFTAASMIGFAAVLDGLKFLLDLTIIGDFVTWLIGITAAVIFFLWFAIKGVNYRGSKASLNLLISVSATMIDLIPFINALPATVGGVVGVIITSRIEDAKKHGETVKQEKMVAMARLARMRAMQSQRLAASAAEQIPPQLRAGGN